MIDKLLSFVAPSPCYGCGEIGQALCDSCIDDIVTEPYAQCVDCLRPVGSGGNLCQICRASSTLAQVWCVGDRDGVLLRLIDGYKFDAVRELGGGLAKLIDGVLPQLPNVKIVAIPTARAHTRTLGYDHMALIARELAAQRQWESITPLRRVSEARQHFKTRAERLRAAADMFVAESELMGSILLIDDVFTTGATLRAAATQLRAAGAERVYGAVIARQPLD